MKKRIVTLVVFLLIACLMLTGCSNGDGAKDNTTDVPATEPAEQTETVEEAPQNENRNADGMYEWTVRGVVIPTRTNIMDYIHDDVWECERFSEGLGWKLDARIVDALSRSVIPLRFDYANASVILRNGHVEGGETYGDKFCFGVSYYYGDGSRLHYVDMMDVYASKKPGDYYVDDKEYRHTITFDSIVYYTYICEHLADNPDVNPLLELLGEPPHGMSEDYEL